MVKRNKHRAKESKSARRDKDAASEEAADSVALEPHPPAKRPVLLGISIVLFVLWLIFLLVAAWPR